jgi:hypothetical protein
MSKKKSVLDEIAVKKDKSFKEWEQAMTKDKPSVYDSDSLVITGSCPHCGAMIYGKPVIKVDETPVIKYTCSCYRKPGVIEQIMETK